MTQAPANAALQSEGLAGPALAEDAATTVVSTQGNQLAVPVITGMTNAAAEKFKECVREFGLALSRETSRLEEAQRATDVSHPEITATMVIQANDAVRNPKGSEPRPVPAFVFIAQIATFPLAIFAGVFGSYLNSWWQWTGMIGLATIGILAAGYSAIALWRRQ